jgi:lipid-A-disaccharide synthase
MKKKIFWLAGEKSGDLHASKVLQYCRQHHPDWVHFGVGGKRMEAEGFVTRFEFSRFNVMGFLEVIRHLSFFAGVEKKIARIFREEKPDAVVLVDYPGLNMRIAKLANQLGIKVLYYICPQFWAWKKHRIFQLRDNSDAIGYILPFEEKYFADSKIVATYTGHPISEEFEVKLDRNELASELGIDPAKRWIAFFPGSRDSEIKKLLPEYLKAMQMLSERNWQFLVSRADSVTKAVFDNIIKAYQVKNLPVIDQYNYEMMKHADFLCVKSGTSTLETAYAGTPFIICYRTSWLSYLLGRLLVNIKWIGLPNIILQKTVLPELIQQKANALEISKQIAHFIDNETDYNFIRQELEGLHELLGKKSASQEVTQLLEQLVNG